MIKRTLVSDMKIVPSTMPSTNTTTATTNAHRKPSTSRCDTVIRDILDQPSDGECIDKHTHTSNIFGLDGSNFLDSIPGTGDFTFINGSSCSASSCELDQSATESLYDKAVNTEISESSNLTKQVSLASEPILHVSSTASRTLFDYEDHEIMNLLDSSSIDSLFKYVYNYKAPATLAEHQMQHAYRIPKTANILVFGKTGHGKSSFINTVEKCLGSKMWPRAKLGSRAKPGTEELVMYDIAKNINFIDTRGQVSFGSSENEELYQVLSSTRPMGHLDRDVDKTSTLLNKYKHKVRPHIHDTPSIHLAVLVVSKDVTDEELVGISNFIESLSMMKLKVVAILTKVDLIPPKVRDDEVVRLTNRLLSIGVAKVCPVSNLPATGALLLSETSRKQILVAMKHILSCFETYTYQYDNQQNNAIESASNAFSKGVNLVYLLVIVFMLMIAIYISIGSLCTLLQLLHDYD